MAMQTRPASPSSALSADCSPGTGGSLSQKFWDLREGAAGPFPLNTFLISQYTD